MSKSKRTKLDSWLYCNTEYENAFAMVTADLLESDAYKSLSHAAQAFYIVLVTHKKTGLQRKTLFNTLKDYHNLTGEPIDDFDISCEAGTYAKLKKDSPYFVIPEKQLKAYGYSSQYASKLKKELIAKGFIKIYAFDKGTGGYSHAFSKKPTVYKFIDEWKK